MTREDRGQAQPTRSKYLSMWAIRRSRWRRDQGQCIECGSKENIEYDHIIPWSKGGGNTARNIQLLCQKCNRNKSDKEPGTW